ncbi:unnamed protein product [Ceutorhynchus assimilis]|uniref:sphingosine kinase n=1 Tax=Ceutorhynchus assimilis TaxID=467358 RepID=A0A9N9Q9V1_9CUCU|nr:unnamed protein product [Ceutorhynchus assimilis]
MEIEEPQILLEETFYVLSKKSDTFKVRLTPKGLHLIQDPLKEQLVLLKDIIGCQCLRGKKRSTRNNCTCQSLPRSDSLQVVEENSSEKDDTDVSAYLYIYAYIFQGPKKRERNIITLRFRSFDKHEDNHKEAQRWRCAIKNLIKGEPLSNLNESKHRETRRLLVLCNPKSGAGKGKQIFQQKVAPILNEAEIPYDLYVTKHFNFARDFVRCNNLFQWTEIIAVGGDGIVFEIINGIFERPDWAQIIKSIPIGVVPGGSGNGLARSIAHHSAEPYLPAPTLPAALAAVRGTSESMDLVRVETVSQIVYSFLSIGWGLLSDIDIESERLRVLGGTRFTVWSLARLIGLRSYKGKLWYLPASTVPVSYNSINSEREGSTLDFPAEIHLETEEGRPRVDSWYSAHSRRSAYFSTGGSSYQSTTDSGLGDGDLPSTVTNRRMYGPAPQLPSVTAPLPENWKCIEGRFVMVHASYQTHLGEDCLFAPEARLNDGRIWLLIVKHGASRSQLLQFLLGLTTGAHANENRDASSYIELIPVNAFRIEPDMGQNGYITVDGEHVEYGPIQAEIFPELARVMVP